MERAAMRAGILQFEHGDSALMGQIVRLADRARRGARPRQAPRPLGESAYFCTRCEADRFLLYPAGLVQCANCGAQMENLGVAERPPEESS
jgi:hypothetical protein